MNNPTPEAPRPVKVTLVTAPQYPLGTLYYVWKQSRHNKPLPSPEIIEMIMNYQKYYGGPNGDIPKFDNSIHDAIINGVCALGFEKYDYSDSTKRIRDCAKHIQDEINMILHESIPVVENLNFVFHLENIPISLREQLVRHRIGTMIDPRVGADIVPVSLMEMKTIPDLAESSWWSQTSRVVPFDTFFDEGRYILPESLEGKSITVKVPRAGDNGETLEREISARSFYINHIRETQEAYKLLMSAGVHIEDCRNIIPVGATHGITWSVNLKALLHIFGKRSSWIAQVNIWGDVMGQMADELVNKVHPMMRMVLLPQCIKKGKYVGCPVSGTNAERIAGVDGMPPCPIWVRYETDKALEAVDKTLLGGFPGAETPNWIPRNPENKEETEVLLNWDSVSEVEKEMLLRNSEKYSKLWGFNVLEEIPNNILEK